MMRSNLCEDCGGKPGEHGPGCERGDREIMEVVQIELGHEERRRLAREDWERRKLAREAETKSPPENGP